MQSKKSNGLTLIIKGCVTRSLILALMVFFRNFSSFRRHNQPSSWKKPPLSSVGYGSMTPWFWHRQLKYIFSEKKKVIIRLNNAFKILFNYSIFFLPTMKPRNKSSLVSEGFKSNFLLGITIIMFLISFARISAGDFDKWMLLSW